MYVGRRCNILVFHWLFLQSLKDSLLDHLFTLHGVSHAIVTQVSKVCFSFLDINHPDVVFTAFRNRFEMVSRPKICLNLQGFNCVAFNSNFWYSSWKWLWVFEHVDLSPQLICINFLGIHAHLYHKRTLHNYFLPFHTKCSHQWDICTTHNEKVVCNTYM